MPTVAESGYPGFEAFQWYALLVPGGTPKTIVERIRSDALQTMKHPEVQNAMARAMSGALGDGDLAGADSGGENVD